MLNLLPTSEKQFLKREQKKRLAIVLGSELLVFLVCLVLVFAAINFYILGRLASQEYFVKQAELDSQSPGFFDFMASMINYNKKLMVIDSFYKNQKPVTGPMQTLLSIERPEGVYFTRFSLSPDQNSAVIKAVISGKSDTRDHLLGFRANIESENKIQNIVFSPDSWINQKDIIFNLTLDITQ
jgi:hypothetical protein